MQLEEWAAGSWRIIWDDRQEDERKEMKRGTGLINRSYDIRGAYERTVRASWVVGGP